MTAYALIVCGGSGTRMGASMNKTLLSIGGVPAIVRAYNALRPYVSGIVVVVRAQDAPAFQAVLDAHGISPLALVAGGDTRQASVYHGLKALPPCDVVLVHDGARPLVVGSVIQDVIAAADTYGASVAALPVSDTIKRADDNGMVLETLKREELYAMQTPQGFRYDLLLGAHQSATRTMTDDAALVEALGHPVHLVMGSAQTLKLTTKEDVRMANAFFDADIKIGHGFDAHRLVLGRPLILGGVTVPYDKGLLGHSDADVAVHALMDALLGALALPDIGAQFPDTDGQYEGVSSLALLSRVKALTAREGYVLKNADVTLVAQAPKLAPHVAAMRENIARALSCDASQISVKATTTEHMGYTGRGEGVSAHAVALLIKTSQMPEGGTEQ